MSAPVISPGGTIVQTFKQTFAGVSIDADKGNAVDTTQFLDAAESLATMFDVINAIAFSPVKADMLGNIKKLRDRQLASPAESQNIQDLCRNELKAKKHTATEGLLWLTRALDFTQTALSSNLADPSKEISESFRGAYSLTLKPYHSFIVKPIFSVAMSACPYRKDFYAKLGSDDAKVQQDMRVYLAAMQKIVGILKSFLDSKEAKW